MLTPAAACAKLLHVGNDRELAYRLEGALQRARQDVVMASVGRLADAKRWVSDNPDFGALIIEDHVQNQSCAGFIGEVRGLGLTAPVVAISVKGAEPPLAALRAGADDYVVNGQSLVPDLAGAVVRSLRRAKGLAAKRPLRCLYLGDSALARESFEDAPHAIQIVESGPPSTGNANPIPVDVPVPGQKFPFDVVLAEHGRASVDIFAILKDLTVRRLQVPVIFVVEWDEELIVPALKMGAVDYVLKTRAAFEALSVRIDRLRSGSILAREFDDLLRQQAELRASLEESTTTRATLEIQLADAETTVHATAEQHAAMTRTAAELQEQQAQNQRELTRTIEARDALAEQLEDVTSALEQARQREASDAAATEHLARREAELTAKLDDEIAARRALQKKLTDSEQRASEERKATAQERSQRRAEFEARLAQESAGRETAQQQVKDLATALEQSRRTRAADAMAAADRLAQREHELAAAIAETAGTRDVLEQRLRAAEAALHDAVECAKEDRQTLIHEAEATLRETEQRAVAERKALIAAASKRESDFEARVAYDADVRRALEQKVEATEETLRETVERHASEMASASEQLAADRAQHCAELAQSVAARDVLERRLSDVTLALEHANAARASDGQKAAERLAQREAELTSEISEVAAKLAAVEQRLAASDVALQQAKRRASAEREAAANEASRQKAEFEARLDRVAAAHRALEQKLATSEATLRDATEQHASEVARSETQLAEMAVARELLQQQLNDVSTALEHALHARALEAAEAAERLKRRESELTLALTAYRAECDAKFAEAAQIRGTLEQQLKDTSLALDDTKKAWAVDVSTAAERLTRREAELTATFTAYRSDCDAKFAKAAQIRSILERQMKDTSIALDETKKAWTVDASAAAERLKLREGELTSALAAYRAECDAKFAEAAQLRDTLERQLRDTSLALDDTKKAWAVDASAAADRLSKREAELTAYRADGDAKLAEAANTRHTLEQQLKNASQALGEMMRAGQALEARVSERDAQLKDQADLHRRQFERLPLSTLRCSREGAIEQVNDAVAAMLGYRAPQQAKAVDFATAVFESPDDWRWLINRCLETGAAESLDTVWKKKDGVRIPVRLLAVTTPSGHIDVVAENLAQYRELEEKLRRSERMEAVGRLASEVASTCDELLRDVGREGFSWLATVGDSPIRQQGEAFLNDITRAASFLRQLDVYSRTQSTSSGPVDLNRVLRNLTSVLKRVAGDDVEFVLPKRSSPLHVDIELDRVERIFVNVAAYGRERMPFGGQLKFEFANAMVGRESVVKHPDLRPGPHVLVTVTAVRYAVWSDASRTLPRLSHTTKAVESAPDRVGMDLGAIQGLIRGCGGRLWIAAEPPGDMVLQIHLPQSMAAAASAVRTSMPRPMQRWLHPGR